MAVYRQDRLYKDYTSNPISTSYLKLFCIEHSNRVDHILPPATEFPEVLLCTKEQIFTLISSLSVSKSSLVFFLTTGSLPGLFLFPRV